MERSPSLCIENTRKIAAVENSTQNIKEDIFQVREDVKEVKSEIKSIKEIIEKFIRDNESKINKVDSLELTIHDLNSFKAKIIGICLFLSALSPYAYDIFRATK